VKFAGDRPESVTWTARFFSVTLTLFSVTSAFSVIPAISFCHPGLEPGFTAAGVG
jgi:hypothetical protein